MSNEDGGYQDHSAEAFAEAAERFARKFAEATQSAREVFEDLHVDPPPGAVEDVAETFREALLDEEIQEGKKMTGPTQYAIDASGTYTPVGNTVGALPPGMYEAGVSQNTLYFIPMAVRTDELLRFPDAVTDRVISEIEVFWEREEVFAQYGFPFKRGMLLYGPPGSGKSTTLQLVARDVIARGGFVLHFNEAWLTGYRAIRSIQPEVPIVAFMEDLDALLERRESSTLNLLDGAERLHKVIFLATTNYPEKLDPRVKNRPSRFDRRFEVPHPGENARRLFLESLLTHGSVEDFDVDQVVKDTAGLSMAHIKELFVATVIIGQPYETALAELRAMNDENPRSTDELVGTFGQYA